MIRQLLVLATALLVLSATPAHSDDKLVVHYRAPEGAADRRHEYFRQVLALALDKTRTDFGDFQVVSTDFPVSQARAFELLKQGKVVDVVWTMTTDGRENEALAVRVPLLKGLLACRVLLIHADDRERFSRITTLDELRRFSAVQGAGWPDTDILKANGMQTVVASDYDGMFHMLAERRIDFFPRSVMEVGTELETFDDLRLAVAPGLALQYEAPIYFFVAPGNHALHERLSVGLARAASDGSFDALFSTQPGNAHAQRILASIERVFHFRNPLLNSIDAPTGSCGTATTTHLR